MPRTPNYSVERKDRDRAKANKKAEKLAAKAAAKERAATGKQDDAEAAPEMDGQGDR
jgi:hypothetical protein